MTAKAGAPTVLQIMQCTNMGGMEQVAYRAMEALTAQDGWRFRIITPRPFGPGKERILAIDPEARDYRYRGRFGWRDFPAFRRDVRAVAAGCSHVWVTGTSAAGLAAVRSLRQPKVLSHHYHHFEGRGSWLRWRLFYELACRPLDAITYVCNFTRNEALRIAPWLAERAVVVPNGLVLNFGDEAGYRAAQARARAELGIPGDAFVVGAAGAMIPRKRFDVFLDVARAIADALPEAQFFVCGDGPMRESLQARCRALGLQDRVRFPGWVRDLTGHYRAWDVMMFNSDYDAMGCPQEAASFGCPTVASVVYGGMSEFIDDGRNGFILPRHDVARLADTVIGLARDRGRIAALREGLRNTLLTGYSEAAGLAFYRRFFTRDAGGAS